MRSVHSTGALLAAVLIMFWASPLFATGVQDSTSQPPEVTEVDWFLNLTWYNYGGVWGEDRFSRLIEDEYGVRLNFITPAEEGAAQINTMIASGDLPDLVTVESWLDHRRRMAQAGLLWSYNELIDTYDPSFWDIAKMDIFNWYRENDGKTYGLPNFGYSSQDVEPGKALPINRGFTLRTDLYEQIGRPGPHTADGNLDATADQFLRILQQVKQIGEYNGLPIVPLQLYQFTDGGPGNESIQWLAQYFATPIEDRQGNYLYNRAQENYFQAIAFLNEAYNTGVLSPEAFTDTREQINQKTAAGRVFASLTAPQDFMSQFRSLYESDENATYEGFVVRNNAGDDPTLTDIAGFGWLTTSIAKSTEVPDKLIKLVHFLYSEEGQHTAHFGFEGETFNYVDGRQRIEWVPEFQALSPEERSQTYGTGFMLLMDWVSVMNMLPPPEEEWNFTSTDEYEMKAVGLPYSYDGKSTALRTNPDDPRNDDMRTLETAINSFWSKQLPKMITAASVGDARTVWQDSLAELDAMGLPDLIDYNNDRFQGTKEALGIDFSWPPNRR